MSNENIKNELEGLKARFENLSIGDLRSQAAKVYGLRITRDQTKEDLIELILGHVAKTNVAHASDGDLKPGWARVKLNNTGDYRSEQPVYLNANGYETFIPFGVEVDIPIRALESLKNAVEFRVYVNEFQEKAHKFSDSYPFTVLGVCEGPDPRPGLEVRREAKIRPKRAFYEQFEYYPTDKQFRDMVTAGLFKPSAKDFKAIS